MRLSNSRRQFMQVTCAGVAASLLTTKHTHSQEKDSGRKEKVKLGLASYSLRSFSLDEALEMTKKVGLQYRG